MDFEAFDLAAMVLLQKLKAQLSFDSSEAIESAEVDFARANSTAIIEVEGGWGADFKAIQPAFGSVGIVASD